MLYECHVAQKSGWRLQSTDIVSVANIANCHVIRVVLQLSLLFPAVTDID